jgi:hypothetical protein
MNVPFRAISAGPCLSSVKFADRLALQYQSRFPRKQQQRACHATTVVGTAPTDERTMTMMYATLTLMAALIAIMFVATAVSSVINAIRENEAVKNSVRRSMAL